MPALSWPRGSAARHIHKKNCNGCAGGRFDPATVGADARAVRPYKVGGISPLFTPAGGVLSSRTGRLKNNYYENTQF